MSIVSSMDFFYPLIDDPYQMGRIGCLNVISDLYAMGITKIDNILMILGVCTRMSDIEQDVVTSLMIKGFNDVAQEAGTQVTGGQTVYNSTPMIGGCAIASGINGKDFMIPNGAEEGQVLIMTKPIGVQMATNVFFWMNKNTEKWKMIQNLTSRELVEKSYFRAIESMGTSNLNAAKLIQKYGVKSCTDVTGFGILGHARYLAKAQRADVSFRFHSLPLIKHTLNLDKTEARNFKTPLGLAPETSGGLLLTISQDNADSFIRDLKQYGQDCWIVGDVIRCNQKTANIIENRNIIQVE